METIEPMNMSKEAIEAAMHDIFVAMTEENTEGQDPGYGIREQTGAQIVAPTKLS